MDDELVAVLRREQRLLELLLFRLVATRHLLVAGDLRFLVRASAEIRIALDRVRETDVLRAVLTERLARAAGVHGHPVCTLRAVAESRPSPYGLIYDDLRTALERAVSEASEVASSVRALAAAGLTGLDRRPAPSWTDHDATLDHAKDRQALQAALTAAGAVMFDALAETLC